VDVQRDARVAQELAARPRGAARRGCSATASRRPARAPAPRR
jgi:hypothetical protein